MASQLAALVPGQLWSGKKQYMVTEMIHDESILEKAGVPGADIASTAVLYTYADFGWLAPMELLFQLVLYILILDLIVRLSTSFAVWMLSIFVALAMILQVDAANFGAFLFYTDYTVLSALMISVAAQFFPRTQRGIGRSPASAFAPTVESSGS